MKIIKNGDVCTPAGFAACGIKAGLKKSGNTDMALIFSETPCESAGVFTSCRFAAAPVKQCIETLKKGNKCRAVIINSGNANACTGKKGLENARKMAELTAGKLKVSSSQVLVCSTGRIGVPMPMDKISKGIEKAIASLSNKGGGEASAAIMTTDTFAKKAAVSSRIGGRNVTVAGMAKGAGMIAPDLKGLHATMICIITTDADIERGFLQKSLVESAEKSFNRITVDGDTSTNDTILVLANGVAGNRKIRQNSSDATLFRKALDYVTTQLARQVVVDGEGVTKFVTVKVEKAASEKDALKCAKTIANSLLCKTAWFGCDPNWGRILAAAGRAGASFNPDKVDLYFDKTCAVRKGMGSGIPEEKLAEIMRNEEFSVRLVLNSGKSACEVWTNDISYEYVEINADYHT